MASNKRAGWYIRLDMHNTLGFWDGNAWTDQTAPSYRGIKPSAWAIAGGVALGSLLAGFIAIVVSLFT
jgi:hypothetical protein